MLVYLHGFNSSAQSRKAVALGQYLERQGLSHHYACPTLPHRPGEAIAAAEAAMGGRSGHEVCFVGSSLGGFYATHLAHKHGARAVLINPAIDPHRLLRAYLGPQRNLYTGASYELTEDHLKAWERLCVPAIVPSDYLLLVETGDEVLDYREAVRYYAGAEQVVVEGGDHTLQSFEQHLPGIVAFARLV